jgi:GT2 family glycosyltransferase
MSKKEEPNNKKVAFFLIATEGRQFVYDAISQIAQSTNLDIFVISHNAPSIEGHVKRVNDERRGKIHYIESSNNSVCQKRNAALELLAQREYDYCFLSDDDIRLDLSKMEELIDIFARLPQECVVLSPIMDLGNDKIFGGLLYRNGTFMSLTTQPRSRIWYSLFPSAAFIVIRPHIVLDMFEKHILPFEDLFVMQSEDVDFAVKIWLLGRKIACTNLVQVQHLGSRSQIPYWRIFYMYRNRVLLLLLNFSKSRVVVGLPVRIINDLITSVFSFRSSYVLSLLTAYAWIIKNLRLTLTLRKSRRTYFVGSERCVFSNLLLPKPRMKDKVGRKAQICVPTNT